MKKIIFLVALSMGAMSAIAEEQKAFGNATPFLGVSVGSVDYSEELGGGFEATADVTMLSLRGGLKFNDYVSAELRLGKSSSDTANVFGFPVEVEVESYLGAYAKGHLPINDNFNAYGLLGFTKASFSADAGFGAVSDDESDMSYGLGVEFWQSEKRSGRIGGAIEYINYYDKNATTVDSIELSLLVSL
jgi:hypothetical protein